jgi:hypothetical protein
VLLTGAGDRFFVAVRPCPDDQQSLAEFVGYIEARTHARLLRFEHSWQLVDEVDAATRRRAEEAEERRLEAKRNGTAS